MQGKLRNLAFGALAATAIAGCGSDDGTIPEGDADTLLARLEAIDQNVGEGQCPEAQAQAVAFVSDVRDLPGSVDDEVKQGLEQSADQLVNLASSECEPEEGASGVGGVQTTETEPTTTETSTTTEETTAETTTEDEPEESAEPQADEPEQDQDLAPSNQGQGGGSGNVGSDGGVGPSGGVGGGGGE